ncbi:MAG: hypothetical protein WBA66_05925 [Xanthobacteraceae bacterium]
MHRRAILALILVVAFESCAAWIIWKSGHPGPQDILSQVYARFDSTYPGRGVADYPGNTIVDIPKSYAAILMAELQRARNGISPDLPDLAGVAGRWLLDNARLDSSKRTGWGVPVAWDAYGDGSINPANTVYSISTGIVVDALLDWMETDPSAPGEEILVTVEKSLLEFARWRTPSGLLPYSLQESDQKYDTFNPAAYLAGQMQRFSKYANEEVAEQLRYAADATVRSLVDNHYVSPSGAWYWKYSIQEDVTNDLAHASYIVDGLETYAAEGGRLTAEIKLQAVVDHLKEFVDGDTLRAWPIIQVNIPRPARLYDLGMALVMGCRHPSLEHLGEIARRSIDRYRRKDEFTRYPVVSGKNELIINEYEAYLWRGLIACSTTQAMIGPAKLAPFRDSKSVKLLAQSRPFGLSIVEGREEVEQVLASVKEASGSAAIVRNTDTASLFLVTIDTNGDERARLEILPTPDSRPDFRAVTMFGGDLYIVYYDNPTLGNYLARYRRDAHSGYQMVGDPTRLPSLEDPAGGTYEMIPAVFLLPGQDELHIVGGTLSATLTSDNSITKKRLTNCSRAVEAILTSRGPVALCAQKSEAGRSAPFELVGPEGVKLPAIDSGGIPFNLRLQGDSVEISFARTAADYSRMLEFDLRRLNGGLLEYGIDNVEGRIPWSEIYYLNGFLDILQLAKHEPRRWSSFEDLLGAIKARLDRELSLLDNRWRSGRYVTRAFSVDRSEQLFAVQTSRLLLLFDRYRQEIDDAVPLAGYDNLRSAVSTLDRHIDVLTSGGQRRSWIPPRVGYLSWPKGSAFYFDGLNVPYNHQNEWAYAMLKTAPEARSQALGIIEHFLRRIAPDGGFPLCGRWAYWWGQAYDGWEEASGVSINKPVYIGDHIAAWISFRSIDAMAVLAASEWLPDATRFAIQRSISTLIKDGFLYPFVQHELRAYGLQMELPESIARRYVRISSAWEVQNAAWAYDALLSALQPQ